MAGSQVQKRSKPQIKRATARGKSYPLMESDHLCRGHKTGGSGYCTKSAGWGTWHLGVGRCKNHGGAAPTYTAEVHRLRAIQAVATYGMPVKIDPHTALIQELERTVGHVLFLKIKVDELEENKMVGPVGGAQGGYPEWKANVWINMYQAERKHLESMAKTCIQCGIEERRVQLAEAQGQMIAKIINGILEDLGVADEPETPQIVRKHLTLLGSGSEEAKAA